MPTGQKTGGFCYIDHSKPVTHPYYVDHMNAHVRTEDCERREKRARARSTKRKTASVNRTKQPDIVYIQRDLEAMKHTLDNVLRPYKADVKGLRAANLAFRESIARKEDDVEALLRFIAKHNNRLIASLVEVLSKPRLPCRGCGAIVPEARNVYVTPLCYGLPPPEPLEVIPWPPPKTG